MNVPFIVCDPNGRILYTGSCPESMVSLQGEFILVGEADPQLHYVVDGEVVNRPDPGYEVSSYEVKADNTDMVTISGVRGLTHVSIIGPHIMEGETDEDGPIFLSFAAPGRYAVTLTNYPYLDKEFVINAV